jgi:hypothetical protein
MIGPAIANNEATLRKNNKMLKRIKEKGGKEP